ncbi:MAG: TldD/PmbA family protein [Oligoflexia bacterium]|nr:TldD/PmbA family protein [Oligoflexia bacterium]
MSDILKEALAHLHRKQPLGAPPRAEWFGFREVRETTTVRYVRDGIPRENDVTVSKGVMAEALVNGQFGYAATSRLDPESLVQAAEQALEQARRASRWAIHRFTVAERPPVTRDYASPVAQPLGGHSPGELNALLVEICHKLKRSPKIIRTSAFTQTVEMEMRTVSSNGSDARQMFSLISVDFEATAQEGSIIQKRTDGGLRGNSRQGGWEFLHTADLWERVERVAEQALELVAAPECPTEVASLILKPDQMMLQIHESIGHPLELDRILGDERNYAGWSFVKKEDFGTLQYGSPLMNVTFDPTVPTEFASYAFDDSGCEATREYLIREGKLLRGLGGLESQARSGIPGVANARASSWNRAPIDRMANLNLEPGDSSLEELIASVERGVIMEANRSWSIDDFRNKFQFGCEYGQLIENGRITRTVRNPNYRGVTVPFWRSLKKVGNGATRGIYGTPYCGKGEPNQAIRVGHASPACLFENIEIFGGAS